MACKYIVRMIDQIAPASQEKLQKDLIEIEQERTRQIRKNSKLFRLTKGKQSEYYIQQWIDGVEKQAALESSAKTLQRLLEIRRWYDGLRRRLID